MKIGRKLQLWKLANLMNKQNRIPVPVTTTLLECFDKVISESECEFMLDMGTEPFHADTIVQRVKTPSPKHSDLLAQLLRKGIIWERSEKDGTPYYVLAPIFIGWFEFQFADGKETEEQKEFAVLVTKLFRSWKKYNIYPLSQIAKFVLHKKFQPFQTITPTATEAGNKGRIIHVGKNLDTAYSKVVPAQNIFHLVQSMGENTPIAVMHCFCRQWHKMTGCDCEFNMPRESCLVVGDMATYAVKYGFGRAISFQEATHIIDRSKEAGAIHTIFHDKDDIMRPVVAICNCCRDCCGLFGSYNKGHIPLYLKRGYLAKMKAGTECVGCGLCMRFCPVHAIEMDDKTVCIDEKKCIGCGQCVNHCKNGAIGLIESQRDVFLPARRMRARAD